MDSGRLLTILSCCLLLVSCGERVSRIAARDGGTIYEEECASCHGDRGQGVDEEYDEPLWGDKSVESLARYIHKSMPEENEEAVEDEEAAVVAGYIHDAFYSPAAQARNTPPRVELTRLTNIQYRQTMADLVGSFGPRVWSSPERGLKGSYFNSEKMAKEKDLIVERVDGTVDFDFGTGAPAEKMTQQGFGIRWNGSLLVPDSGEYDIRLRTHNGATLRLNSFASDRDSPFIDAYVSTNNTLREKSRRVFLLGGRPYPIQLKYFSFKEKRSSIHLEWKRPHGVWEAIPEQYLSPKWAPPTLVVQTPFSADDRSAGYERGSAVSKDWQEATTYAAVDTVNHIIANLESIGKHLKKDLKKAEELQEFCQQFAERAFRRPLTPELKANYVDSRFARADPEVAAKRSLLLVLTSPRFLYPGVVDNEGSPDSYTIASRLALMLWDTLPDQKLRQKAAEGALLTAEAIEGEARRMLKDPRARQKIRGFFRHWLAMDEREDLGKDPKLYPGFDQRIVADLRASLETFVDGVVWSDESDYRQLLLADYLPLNARLAEFYHAPKQDSPAFVKIVLPEGQRAGIFTHPYLLSANAYHDSTSPIHRGVFLSRNIMGRLLKPPPEAVAFKNEEFDPTLTMREKVTQLTKKDTCMQCHRVINPIGFSLENFDAVGRFRTEDNKKPVNTVSDYVNDEDEKVQLGSARELAELTVGSDSAHRAFLTHLFHHLTKQSITAYGDGVLDSLCEQFVGSDYHMQTMFLKISTRAAVYEDSAGSEPTGPTPPPSS